MTMLKSLVKWIAYPPIFAAGLVVYAMRRKLPERSYQAMIWLFCVTRGRSNDLFSRVISWAYPPYRFGDASGVLGDMNDKALRTKVARDLRVHGYHVFDRRLPEDLCDRLLRYALTHECRLRPMDGMTAGGPVFAVYHRDAPRAVRYEFTTQDLLRNEDVQSLLADLSFAAVAQDYLGCRPLVDVMGLWWHTGFSDVPDSEAAQFFHFDMDRFKWVKFFLYLTDVEPENGPHSFIAGSHRTGAISARLLDKGYARLTDEEVRGEFAPERIIEITGKRGTVIAEDTRGLHKGKHVLRGDRLVLQFQFSNSLLGTNYPRTSMGYVESPALRARLKEYPQLYNAYR
jgi:hypothetical protein